MIPPQRPSVLVVDDQEVNVELARALLEQEGLQVQVAFDARQADAQINRQIPSLVLLDIQMPGEDGLTLLARWQASPRTRGLRVVAFTAYAMDGDRERFIGAGCVGYISKPVEVATFGRTVVGLLRPLEDPAQLESSGD